MNLKNNELGYNKPNNNQNNGSYDDSTIKENIKEINSQLEHIENDVNTIILSQVQDIKNIDLQTIKEGMFIRCKDITYRIVNDVSLIGDGEYTIRLKDDLFAVSENLKRDFKQNKYRGICVTVTTNKDNYHITQVRNQLDIVKQIKCGVQLAIGVNFGDASCNGEMSLCITEDELQNVINIINNEGLKINMIKLHSQSTAGSWDDLVLNPSDATLFFSNFSTILNTVAKKCSENDIDVLMMINEQTNIVTNTYYSQWSSIIQNLKRDYSSVKLGISYTYDAIINDLTKYNLSYQNCVSKLLDFIGINFYPQIHKDKIYNYSKNVRLDGMFRITQDSDCLYKKENPMTNIVKIKENLGEVIITETGGIQYDTNDTNILCNSGAILNESMRTGTEGLEQELYYKEVIPYLNNITSGVYVWCASYPFIPKGNGLNYLKNKLREVF